MGTVLKYVFYVALIIIIYLVGKGIFEGNINEDTTVGQVVDDVKSGTADMASGAVDKAKDAVNDVRRNNAVRPASIDDEQGALNVTKGEYQMTENTYHNGEPSTWEKAKEVSSDAWEATKDTSAKVWDKTKEVSGNAWDKTKEVSGDAWDATKDASGKAWDKTKEVSSDAWDATKGGAQKLKEKVSDSTDDAADEAVEAADDMDDAAYHAQQRNSSVHENRIEY